MNQGGGQNDNRVRSFLEALKDRQATTQETGLQPFGGLESFSEKKKLEEARKGQFLAERRKEEIEIFSATRSAKERRITEIHERLVAISKRIEKRTPEVRKAVIQNMVKPGRSDESLLDHWQKLIEFFSNKAENSGNWLMMFNARSKKQGVYWEQAKKGGSKYTQALDRNVATSVG